MTSRTYQHGLLVANSAQRHCSSIDIDIDPTSSSSSNEVHLDLGNSSSSTTNDNSNASTRYAAAYLACIAGGSVVPHKDRSPRHMKPSSSSSSYSTHQNSSPLLWIYNSKTHRWRSTYLTIGNSLSTASSFVNIPHMNDDQYCPRTNTPSFMHSTHSLDELVRCSSPIPMMSVKSIDSSPSSSSSCPSTPLAHSSFDYGDFSNHSSMDVGGYYYYSSPPPSSDTRPVKSSPMKIASYPLPSSPKHTIITSTLNNNKDDILKGKQRQLGFFEPTRQQRRRRRSSSVLISEHSHLAGGVSVVFAVAWHGIHTIILLTQRRSSHCLEIVSREVTRASSMVGMPHPAVHKVIQLPPGYLPTLLEMRDVTAVCHSKEGTSTEMSSPPIRFPHDWREKTGSSKQEQEDITHTESNAAGMDSRCSSSSGLDIADTCCVVVVSDGRTMLCYSISRELQRVGKKSQQQQHQQQPPTSSSSYEHHIGSGTRASSRATCDIYDYTVVELWDIHIASLTEQQHLLTVGPCLRMRSTSTSTATAASASSSSSLGHGRIVLPIRETHLLFIRSCQLSGEP